VFLRCFGLACLTAGVLSGVVTATVAAQGTPTPQPNPSLVVETFERARGAGDVDAALGVFADTAVITLQGRARQSFTGPVALRNYLQTIGTRFRIVLRSRPIVQGSTVTWTERDQFGEEAIDTTVVAIVSGGRIVALTYRDSQDVAARAVLAGVATGPQTAQVPSVAWPAALAALGLGLIALVFGRPRRKASTSQLDGRLLIALQRQRDREDDRAA
jgi:hypothetical protein